jgi:hypothetical protein
LILQFLKKTSLDADLDLIFPEFYRFKFNI